MGLSAPPPASIDLVGSYARRRGSDVEIVLAAPSQAKDAVALELSQRSAKVTAEVTLTSDERGEKLIAKAPRGPLSDGQWALRLVTPDDQRSVVQARLLVQGERPIVLVWGAKAAKPKILPTAESVPARKRLVQAGGRALDSALRPLPADRAVAARRALRRAARRVVR